MSPANPAPLGADELDRLEALLADEVFADEAMQLDEAQGYICAAMSGPEPLAERVWLEEIFGGAEQLDTPAGQEASALLRRFASNIADDLANDERSMPVIFYPEDYDNPRPEEVEAWCMAYLHGVDTASEDWFDALDDEDEIDWLDERLFPHMLLAGEAEKAALQSGEDWPEGEEREALLRDALESLSLAVAEVYRFWLAKRSQQTLRRSNGKIGRNDACPCGSGKKYKQCCGSAV